METLAVKNTGRRFVKLIDRVEGWFQEMSHGVGYSFYYFNLRSLVKNRSAAFFIRWGTMGKGWLT